MNQAPATAKRTTATSYHRRVVLGLEEFDRLDHHEELVTRGLTTPFLFFSLALYITSSGFCRLIEAFVRTCVAFPALDAEHKWREEARFAAPPELAMCLRWGIARVLRFLEATPPAASSLGACTSTGARPKSGSPRRASDAPKY